MAQKCLWAKHVAMCFRSLLCKFGQHESFGLKEKIDCKILHKATLYGDAEDKVQKNVDEVAVLVLEEVQAINGNEGIFS